MRLEPMTKSEFVRRHSDKTPDQILVLPGAKKLKISKQDIWSVRHRDNPKHRDKPKTRTQSGAADPVLDPPRVLNGVYPRETRPPTPSPPAPPAQLKGPIDKIVVSFNDADHNTIQNCIWFLLEAGATVTRP